VTGRVAAGMARTFQITEIFPELTAAMNLRIAVEAASGHPMRPWLSRDAEAGIEQRVADLLALANAAGFVPDRQKKITRGNLPAETRQQWRP
jgi:branched-chain amino acid transport system ATP-binding protein